jgi:uncharacterized protein YcbK (DUF882 family)
MGNKLYCKKGSNAQITKNFNSDELDCKCSYIDCKDTIIDVDHIKKLQEYRDKLNKPVHINCGYRCKKHNQDVGGAIHSQHMRGCATDITIEGMKSHEIANSIESNDFQGAGTYSTFVHVDSGDMWRRWIGN